MSWVFQFGFSLVVYSYGFVFDMVVGLDLVIMVVVSCWFKCCGGGV